MVFAVIIGLVALLVASVNLFYTCELYNIFKEYETDMNMVLFSEGEEDEEKK